jgi:vacuolar-type H+-ATPase subunit E/Vma4
MAEHRLVEAMEEEVAAKISEIEWQTEEAIHTLGAEADAALAEAENLERLRAEQRFLGHKRERRSHFENEWRGRIRNLQFEIVDQVFRELEEMVGRARQRQDYPQVLCRLLDEALRVYRQERDDWPVLRVAPGDCELARARLPEAIAVEVDPAIDGGVELFSPNERFHVKNTLQSRLRKGRDEFLKMISDAIKRPQQNGDSPPRNDQLSPQPEEFEGDCPRFVGACKERISV